MFVPTSKTPVSSLTLIQGKPHVDARFCQSKTVSWDIHWNTRRRVDNGNSGGTLLNALGKFGNLQKKLQAVAQQPVLAPIPHFLNCCMLLFSEIWFCCFPNSSFLLCWLWGSPLLRNWWVYCRGVRICAERYCFCDMLGEPPPRLKPLDEKRQTKRKQTELLQDSTKGTSCQQMFSTSLETCSPGPPNRGVNPAIVSPNGKMI